mgnify:CR=1 FL=1
MLKISSVVGDERHCSTTAQRVISVAARDDHGPGGPAQKDGATFAIGSKMPAVTAAAPYIEDQEMLVNGSHVSGTLIRGIVPGRAAVGEVLVLPRRRFMMS